MTPTATPVPRPVIPVLAILRQSWRTVFGDPGRLLRFAGSGLLLLLLTGALLPRTDPPSVDTLWSVLVSVGVLAFVAVLWHRAVLLGELGPALRVARRLPVYLGAATLLALTILVIALAPALVLGALLGAQGALAGDPRTGGTGAAGWVGPVLGYIYLAYMLARLSLALPGRAIGDGRVGLRGAWALSRGQVWRLVAIQLAFLVLPLALASGMARLAATLGPGAAWPVTAATQVILVLALSLEAVAFSLLYRRLVPRPADITGPAAAPGLPA